MKLRWHGGDCISIKGKGYRVILGMLDIPDQKPLKVQVEDLVILPYKQESYHESIQKALAQDNIFVIDGPGEYSYRGVTVQVKSFGLTNGERMNVVSLSVENVLIVSLFDLDRALEGSETDFIGNPDVLIVPTGGMGVLSAKDAAKVVNMVEPRIVIPTVYSEEGILSEKASVDEFLKEYGSESLNAEPEFIVKKDYLPVETTEVIRLISELK